MRVVLCCKSSLYDVFVHSLSVRREAILGKDGRLESTQQCVERCNAIALYREVTWNV